MFIVLLWWSLPPTDGLKTRIILTIFYLSFIYRQCNAVILAIERPQNICVHSIIAVADLPQSDFLRLNSDINPCESAWTISCLLFKSNAVQL